MAHPFAKEASSSKARARAMGGSCARASMSTGAAPARKAGSHGSAMSVPGRKSGGRLDKHSRKGKKHHPKIAIVAPPPEDPAIAAAAAGAGAAPPPPPAAPPPNMMPPPGMSAGPPPGMQKRGGYRAYCWRRC